MNWRRWLMLSGMMAGLLATAAVMAAEPVAAAAGVVDFHW